MITTKASRIKTMQEQPVHPYPRISANELGEYLVSPPLRRQTIIERQKYPCTYIVSHYEPARVAIVDFIVGNIDRGGLLRRMGEVSEPHGSSCALHTVLRFLDLDPRLDLRGMTPIVVEQHDKLDVGGVGVSIYPDIVLEGRDENGRPIVGSIKLLFSKHPQTEATAEYVATLLRMHTQLSMPDRGKVCEDACIVVDVFAGQIRTAPRAHQSCWRDIEVACDEIRRTWPTV